MVKVKRTFPAPASLEIESKKRTGSYETENIGTGSLTGIIFSGHAATATVLKTKRSMIWES